MIHLYWITTRYKIRSTVTFSDQKKSYPICSTMGVGCQSRRFNCLFWRETRQRILGPEISPYPEVVRGREWELTTRPRERQLMAGAQERQLVAGDQERQLVAGDQERQLAVGQERGELVAGQEKGQLRLETTESSWDWTGERRTERLAWIHGGAVNTRHRNREARRQDRVQWRRVSRCLIPVALWNFR